VTDGPRVGGLFVDGKRQASWEAGAEDTFTAELCLTKAGVLEIGQLVGTREGVIETEIPIPPPGIPVRVQGWMPRFFASSLWDMVRAAF